MQGTGETYPRTAYLLSLVGGILLLIFSLIYVAVLLVLASLLSGLGYGLGAGLLVGLAVVALLFGVIVLVLAIRLKTNPGSAKMSGILIIVFSVISFVGGGGFYIGAILALIGGILAVIWKPPQPVQAAWGQQPMAPPAAPPMSPPPS